MSDEQQSGAQDQFVNQPTIKTEHEGSLLKTLVKQGAFTILNVAHVLVIVWCLVAYSSIYEWVPWHDTADLPRFWMTRVSMPALIAIGIALFVLRLTCRISLLNRLLPLVSLMVFVLPQYFPGIGASYSAWGALLGIAVLGSVSWSTIANFDAMDWRDWNP